MIELLLIRHGETAWNVERRLQGHVDIALNDTGVRQAQALAAALSVEHLDAIVCSDLQRAIQTAQHIAAPRNIACQINPSWRERHFGGFEGELINKLEQRYPAEYAAWRRYEIDTPFPPDKSDERGETIRQFHARIETALLDLVLQFAQSGAVKKIGVVAHGGVLECAYRIAHQLPLHAPRTVSMLNASINRFELRVAANQPQLKLVQWGDVAHLDAALDEISR